MSLLQIFFVISWIIIFFLALDISRKEKFNALHFLVFLLVWAGLLVFTFFPTFLDSLGRVFWVQRWADVLVYSSIVFIFYFILLLLRKTENNRSDLTHVIRELAINMSPKKEIKWEEVFLVRVYNEWPVLEDTLRHILKAWHKNILVVNDGSTDNSAEVLEKFWSKITVLTHSQNRGWWAALKTWFEYLKRYAHTQYIVTFDADGQHDVKNYQVFKEAFKRKPQLDIILGSRFITKTRSNVPFFRRVLLFHARFFTFLFSHLSITDSHNGYRVIRREVLDKIHIHMDGMEYASELLDSIKKNNLRYLEVPVDISYTDYSLGKWQKSSDAMWVGLRFIWSKFFR